MKTVYSDADESKNSFDRLCLPEIGIHCSASTNIVTVTLAVAIAIAVAITATEATAAPKAVAQRYTRRAGATPRGSPYNGP